ncbi:hypothetical protein GGS21DRAFT_539985 [Xylaria nigripes]|nr:hypothetical protein GGS21DRAFT_539985 [Xylaria nigripes]
MSTSKRRKLNTEESPQPMSAFALRKKLLAQQTELLRPSVSQTGEIPGDLSPSSLEEGQDSFDPSSTPQPVNFSTFRPSRSNCRKRKDKVTQLRLEEGERLLIIGSYGICVESGEVTVYGATLKASRSVFWVHAPQSHALPVIRCTNDATVELHSHPGARGLKELGRLSPLFRRLWWEDPNLTPQDAGVSSGDTFRILYASEGAPKRAIVQDLKSPPEWNREVASLITLADLRPSSIMITGPKSSGKSTFGKILTNRLLTSTPADRKKSGYGGVIVLDLDPGQPEYCGAGQIALILVTEPVLSPPFCRPIDVPGIRTIRSHALASLSPASDPELYIEMALDLITHYRNAYGSYPLIINTPGWIQGTGLDLLVSLIGELRPSNVIYMSQLGPVDAVEALEEACNTASFSTLPSQPNQNSLRNAADLRSMQMMAYFHAESTIRQHGGNHLHWFQRPLTALTPWQVRFNGDAPGISGVLFYNFQTQPELVADAINGTILAAVEVENTKAFRNIVESSSWLDDAANEAIPGSPMNLDANNESDEPKMTLSSQIQEKITTPTAEGIPFIDTSHGLTLDPRYSRCLGLVLVRGIDVDNGNLHVLYPTKTGQIDDVRAKGGRIVLVSGKFDPPTWAYTEDFYFRKEVDDGDGNERPDSSSQSEVIGANAALPQSSAEAVPWIEVLARNQKRSAGSKAWRVRRDLGRD